MSSARQILTIGGQLAGAAIGGPFGAAIGGVIGGEVGGLIDGPPEGPRLDDLSAPQVQYGGKIGRLYGGPKWFDCGYLWASEKRESSETVGGKGGDSGQEQFSYRSDILYRVCESREGTPCEVIAVTGVEIDGQLVWTALADAGSGSLAASQQVEDWSDMAVLLGHEDQAPWSVYETAVGATNANAYRGYLTVGFTDFLLASNGLPRRVRIQACTAGTPANTPAKTRWQIDAGISGDDISWYDNGAGTAGAWANADIAGDGAMPMTAEVVVGLANDGQYLYRTADPLVYPDTYSTALPNAAILDEMVLLDVADWNGQSPSNFNDPQWSESTSPSSDPWRTEWNGDAFFIPGSNRLTGSQTYYADAPHFDGTLFKYTQRDSTGATHEHRVRLRGYIGNSFNGSEERLFLYYTPPAGSQSAAIAIEPGAHKYSMQVCADGLTVWVDGVVVYSGATGVSAGDTTGRVTIDDTPATIQGYTVTINKARIRYEQVYAHNTNFNDAYPLDLPPPDAPLDTFTPEPVPLQPILEYEAERCAPLSAANIDFSAAAGLEIDCHVAVGSAAEAMQPMLTRFWFDLFSADKLYLIRRGGSVEQTIQFRWTGAGQGERSDPFAGLIRANDVEVPKKKAITYLDILKDGEADTRTGDRESPGSDVETLQMNLHMIPSEAQGLADTATADARVAGHTATVRVGARHGLLMQPGSVVNLVDHKGNTYRVLVRRIVWNGWVWECEVRLDDPNVLQSSGIAVDVDGRSLTVAEPPAATLYVLDIPLLRSQDDGPGEYVAVTQTGRFRGVDILKSNDGTSYAVATEVTSRATAGICATALGAHDGWTWDDSSVLTVTLDDGAGGTLSSATKAAIEANRALNLAAVGAHGRWELVQFSTATLTSGTTYTLRGILRNLFGTEWANDTHAVADSFVLLQASGMARIPGAISDLGQTRYYKAVPRGRSSTNVTAKSIVCEEQALLPYAPVDVRRDGADVLWNRRSRLEGAVGLDPPLGEASERYDVELYDGVTLEDDATVTVNEWAPATDPTGLTVKVYQLSELVGRGHVAEKDLV